MGAQRSAAVVRIYMVKKTWTKMAGDMKEFRRQSSSSSEEA